MIVAVLLAALLLLNVAWMIVLDRRDQRYSDQLDRERDARQLEQHAYRDERQSLLQRVQAPELAVVQHAQKHAGPDPNPYPLTEEELVRAQDEKMAMIHAIEQAEQNGIPMHMPGS